MGIVNENYAPLFLYIPASILSLYDVKAFSTTAVVHMFLQIDSLSSCVLWSVH